MAIVLTQCPIGCPPCGGALSCGPFFSPNPCVPATDPTPLQAPTVTGSTVTGSTATPLTTPLPTGGSVTIAGTVLIPGPTQSFFAPGGIPIPFPNCWGSNGATGTRAFTLPQLGWTTAAFLSGGGTISVDASDGNQGSTWTATVDVSAGANWNAWNAMGFAPYENPIIAFSANAECCCGWTSCPLITGLTTTLGYMLTATYAWVFNSGSGMYDATLTLTAQLMCGKFSP